MAKVEVHKTTTITLTLTEAEAVYLKNLTQNYLKSSASSFEGEMAKKIRETLFIQLANIV